MQNMELSMEPAAAVNARSKAPVFVLGCPRSGTTLLYHMLLSAGNFAIYRAESQIFNLLEPRFGDLNLAKNRRKLLVAWRDTEFFRRTGLDWNEIHAAVMAQCRNGGDFLRIVMGTMAQHQGAERWADCTPEHLLYLDRIKQTIPEALIIHIIRDGRDVAMSLEKQAWIRPFAWDRRRTLEVAALYWDWMVRKGHKDGQALGSDYIEVRFEDLVLDPKRVLETLSGFVAQRLDYQKIESVGLGSVSEPNSSFSDEMKTGEFSPVCRWKTNLSADQLKRLESLLGETLREFGYTPDGSRQGTPSDGSLKWMRLFYPGYFETKLLLKKKAPFRGMMVSPVLPSFRQEP